MRRQLYRGGGIASIRRQKYGLGDWVRKLIPNELADIAVKAAPFVAPFQPGIAAMMRGIGRYDQRGSLSDALKQGALTYGLGKGIGYLGGATPTREGFLGGQTYSKAGFREGPIGRAWDKMMPERQVTDTSVKKSHGDAWQKTFSGGDPGGEFANTITKGTTDKLSLKGIWDKFQSMDPGMRTAIVGVGSGAIAGVAQWFENQIPQEPGESMDEYLARRKVAVGKLMRQYMDNTRAYDAAWTSMTDQQKDETVAQYNMNQGGRVGYQAGGISMGNTLAQNIAANNAQRAANQAVLQGARKKAFNVFMTPKGNVAKDQGIAQLARDTGIAPQIQNYAINSGTDISRMIGPGTGISSGTGDYGGITHSNLGFAALPSSGQKTTTTPTTVSQINTAPDLTKQSEAYGKMMMQKFEEAYGKPEDYRAEAATLNMPIEAYMDYLMTSDPKNISYQYRKEDPYYAPEFDIPRDPNEIQELSPLNMYYQRELQRQIDAGIPEAERIQKGQVMGMPGVIPTGGTMPSLYESYEDALARNKAAMGLNQGGRVGLYGGGEPEAGIKSLDAGAPDITYEGNEGPQAPMKMASYGYDDAMAESWSEFQRLRKLGEIPLDLEFDEWLEMQDVERHIKGPVIPSDEDPINPFAPKPKGIMMAAKGGRIGYAGGSYNPGARWSYLIDKFNNNEPMTEDEIKEMEMLEISYADESKGMAQGGRIGYDNGGVASMRKKLFDMGYDWIDDADDITVREIFDSEMGTWTDSSVWRPGSAQGGRIGQMGGTGPQGLPGIPRMAPDGMEFDMRQNGGFQPLGAKEKKDDVPAMLAKNEFVFTADAVRGAGGGDIELGAQRMYDTMKNLEKRMA